MPLGAFRINSLAKFTVVAAGEVIRAKKGVAAIGDAKISTAQSQFGGSSAVFDGTGDYLQIAASSDYNFGTAIQTWTIEGWLRLSTLPNAFRGIISSQNGAVSSGGGNDGWGVYIDNNNRLTYISNAVGSTFNSTTGAFTTNTWTHWAVVRNGSSLKMFVNGTETFTASNYTNKADTNSPLLIGRAYNISSGYNGVLDLNGNLDEIRISNIARYTANFTPSTTQFVNDANTVLLLHMDGTNNSTVFEDDTGVRRKVAVRAIADAKISTAQSQFGGSSAIFDGTGDYLEIPNSATAIGTGPFTIDYWFRATSTASTPSLVDLRFGGGDTTGYSDYINSTGKLVVFMNNGNRITSTTTISTNTWYHVAIVRDSSNDIKMYINGTNEGSAYNFSNNMTSTYYRIGNNVSASNGFNGHIDELRISNVARYTANFTPSTAPFVNDANTRLLLHMDGTNNSTYFEDDTGVRSKRGVVAIGDAKISTAQSQFGGSSAVFDGTGDNLLVDYHNGAWNLPYNGDWTIEFWLRFPTISGFPGIMTTATMGTKNGWALQANSSGLIQWIGSVNGTSNVNVLANTPAVSAATWTHIAFVNFNGVLKGYANGVQGSTTSSFTAQTSTTNSLKIGDGAGISSGNFVDSTDFNGNLDEIRISNTARYTANFTAPTQPFQNDTNTLLLLHMDGTNNSTVFIDDNGVTPDWNYTA